MTQKKKIRVLVVDDSLFMRQIIFDILNKDPSIEVIDVAKDGQEGLEKALLLKPDVITLDYEMPRMNGLACLKNIMLKAPTAVIMLSAYTPKEGEITLQALSHGAVDFILKPSGSVSLNMKNKEEEIIEKVKHAAGVNIDNLQAIINQKAILKQFEIQPHISTQVIVLGASTGGPKAIEFLLQSIPKNFPVPMLIAQHMPEVFTSLFASRLNRMYTNFTVKEARKNEILKPGYVYIAPGGNHMEIICKNPKNKDHECEGIVQIVKAKTAYGNKPSINKLMKSVALGYGKNAIGVLLTGMGVDGVSGMETIHSMGGRTIAQDQKTSIIFGMPKVAIEQGAVDEVLALDKIAGRLVELVSNKQ